MLSTYPSASPPHLICLSKRDRNFANSIALRHHDKEGLWTGGTSLKQKEIKCTIQFKIKCLFNSSAHLYHHLIFPMHQENSEITEQEKIAKASEKGSGISVVVQQC